MNKLAIELCTLIEAQLKSRKMHVALTGGTLYKPGDRKDIDILFYNELQKKYKEDNVFMLVNDLCREIPNMTFVAFYGFVCKVTYKGVPIDILYPEFYGTGTYPVDEE